MECADGHCMITMAGDYEALAQWVSADGFDVPVELPDDLAETLLMVPATMATLRDWAAANEANELFEQAQSKHMPFGAVQSIPEIAANPHLEARGMFDNIGDSGIKGPVEVVGVSGGDGEPEQDRRRQGGAPLEGIRVLDLSWVLAGPYACRVLGDLGADAVKLLTEERSQAANDPLFPFFVLWNRNKRCGALNLRHERAAEVLRALVEQSDVVVENYSASVMERLGFGWETLRSWNPRIVYLSMAGCGQAGPWSGHVTYAPTIHALSGMTWLTNPPGRHDVGPGFVHSDHTSGPGWCARRSRGTRDKTADGRGSAHRPLPA